MQNFAKAIKPKLKVDTYISRQQCYDILRDEFPGAQIYIPDQTVGVASFSQYFNFLKLNKIDKAQYISEDYDCDDFARELWHYFKGLNTKIAFGHIWISKPLGSGHALNWFIDNELRLWLVEPQNDKIMQNGANYKAYMVMQ